MVTTERKQVTIPQAIDIIQKAENKEEMIRELCSLPKRPSGIKAPRGGITIRKASRKYRIPHTTISGWVGAGLIPIVLATSRRKYILEELVRKEVIPPGNYLISVYW